MSSLRTKRHNIPYEPVTEDIFPRNDGGDVVGHVRKSY